MTAQLCEDFLQIRGHLPRGKFKEVATSDRFKERNDRLLFFLGTQNDLTLMLALTSRLQRRWSEPFNDQPSILVGEEVEVDGRVLPTVRLAQDPGNGDSFNGSQTEVMQGAMFEALPGNPDRQHATREQLQRFVGAISRHAALNGWNSQRPSFLAAQDMRVIDFAIRNASNYWSDHK